MFSGPRFLLGANLPWVRYGTDFGENAWHPEGGMGVHADPARLRALFEALRAGDVQVLRWFLLCDGRAGVEFAPDGTPLRLTDLCWRDLDAVLRLVSAAGLRLLPVILDFPWGQRARRVRGVTLGGRAATLSHPGRRAALVERIISPLARRYGHDPVVYGWDLLNEPEWITFGAGTWRPVGTITPGSLRRFLRDATAAVHAEALQPVTVGSASAHWLPLVRGLGLDLFQVHWYDRLDRRAPLERDVATFRCDRPVLLGEFPTAGSSRAPAEIARLARGAGYAGAFFWSVLAEDGATHQPAKTIAGAGRDDR